MGKKVWMRVTRDKYELPMLMAESVKELEEMNKVSIRTIYSAINKKNKKRCQYVKVDMEEGEDMDADEEEIRKRAVEIMKTKKSLKLETTIEDVMKFIKEWEKTTEMIKKHMKGK